jgi:hypothetical protein
VLPVSVLGCWVTPWEARFAEAGADARRRIPGAPRPSSG